MSQRNQPFTTDEHRAAGEELARVWAQLLNLGAQVSVRYPRSLHLEQDLADAVAAVDALRKQLSRQAERDLAEDFHPAIYHPSMELATA